MSTFDYQAAFSAEPALSDLRSDLLKRRNVIGAESREGRLLSTLIQQIQNYQKETDPWARANLEWGMNWTKKLLSELP